MVSDSEQREASSLVSGAPANLLQGVAAEVVGLGFALQKNERATDDSQMRFTRSEGGRTIVIGLERGSKSNTVWVSVSTFGVGRVAASDMNPTEVQADRVPSVLSAHLTTHGLANAVQVQAESTLGGSVA